MYWSIQLERIWVSLSSAISTSRLKRCLQASLYLSHSFSLSFSCSSLLWPLFYPHEKGKSTSSISVDSHSLSLYLLQSEEAVFSLAAKEHSQGRILIGWARVMCPSLNQSLWPDDWTWWWTGAWSWAPCWSWGGGTSQDFQRGSRQPSSGCFGYSPPLRTTVASAWAGMLTWS